MSVTGKFGVGFPRAGMISERGLVSRRVLFPFGMLFVSCVCVYVCALVSSFFWFSKIVTLVPSHIEGPSWYYDTSGSLSESLWAGSCTRGGCVHVWCGIGEIAMTCFLMFPSRPCPAWMACAAGGLGLPCMCICAFLSYCPDRGLHALAETWQELQVLVFNGVYPEVEPHAHSSFCQRMDVFRYRIHDLFLNIKLKGTSHDDEM